MDGITIRSEKQIIFIRFFNSGLVIAGSFDGIYRDKNQMTDGTVR